MSQWPVSPNVWRVGEGGMILNEIPIEAPLRPMRGGTLNESLDDIQLKRLTSALAGRYAVEASFARGGNSVLYAGRALSDGAKVAIKVLPPELVSSVSIARFERESRIAASLQHPCILPVIESGALDGIWYEVLPFVEGETLRQRVEREGQLTFEASLSILRDIGDALQYAHDHGVVHRDVKPANILLSAERALLADFGIARAVTDDLDRLTESGVSLGTPSYMSPEQCGAARVIDARSDQYSLACVVFEMIGGEPPFSGQSTQRLMARHVSERAPSLRHTRSTVSDELDAAVSRALEKSPADRFRDVGEFVSAVERAATAPTGRMTRWTLRTKSARRMALMLALASVSVTAAAGTWRWHTTRWNALDANKIVVFPFVDHSGAADTRRAGEEIAIVLGAALEGTEPLKWIEAWPRLSAEERADPRTITGQRERDLARGEGARYFIEGSVVQTGDSSLVQVRLHDAAFDSLFATESVTRPTKAGSLPQIALLAASRIVPRFIVPGGKRLDLALMDLSARNAAAITNWVQGEREYRRASFKLALDLLQRAVVLDSNLAVAAVRGAQAAMWAERPDEARVLAERAIARKEALPAKHVQMALGIRSYLVGDADSATAQLQRALALDSSWSEALMALGETYFHLLPNTHPLDSLAEATFRRAVRSDSTFTPPLFHLAEIELRSGDVPAAQRLLAQLNTVSPDSVHLAILRLSVGCAGRTQRKPDWVNSADAGQLFSAGRILNSTPRYSQCAEEAFRGILASSTASAAERFGATFALHALLSDAQRLSDARALIDDAMSRGLAIAPAFHLSSVFAGLTPVDSLARKTIHGLGGDFAKMTAPRLWYHGTWHAVIGQRDSLTLVAQALDELATRSGAPRDRVIADAVGARVALANGDTARAVSLLRGLRITVKRTDVGFGIWESLAGERMLLARLYAAKGQPREAASIGRDIRHGEPIAFLYFRRQSLHILDQTDPSSALRRAVPR